MIIRSLKDIETNDPDRVVATKDWTSVRMLLAEDGMGYSFHITTVAAGSDQTFEYKNHLEACYCIAGRATVTDLATGQTAVIAPGVLYALDQHDRHRVDVTETLVLACVFNPALTGREVHRADGSYAPPTE